MSCSSARAQTEPLAALVAVVAVAIGLSLYAGIVEDALPERPDRNLAEPTLDRVERAVAPDGVVRPSRLDDATALGPDGRQVNVSVAAGDRRWVVGPTPPNESVDRASGRVTVRVTETRVEPGELAVVTWR